MKQIFLGCIVFVFMMAGCVGRSSIVGKGPLVPVGHVYSANSSNKSSGNNSFFSASEQLEREKKQTKILRKIAKEKMRQKKLRKIIQQAMPIEERCRRGQVGYGEIGYCMALQNGLAQIFNKKRR